MTQFSFIKSTKPLSKSWLELIIIAFVYFILIMLAVYPATRFWNSQMIGGSWDSGLFTWNFWWVTEAIHQGNFLPYQTNMIYYPSGASLAYHSLTLLNSYQAVILHQIGLSFPAAYNTIVVISFFNCALFTYILVKSLTNNLPASFVAGIIFAFTSSHLNRLHFGHIDVFTSAQFIPLLTLCVLRACESKQLRYSFLGALFLAASVWQSLQIGLGAFVLATLLFALFGFKEIKRLDITARWMIMISVAGLLSLPVVYPMLRDMADFPDQSNQFISSLSNSPDLLNFFITANR